MAWEKVQRGLSAPKKGLEADVECILVKSLKLIPDSDEIKVVEWFACYEWKAREFKWQEERWVGLVAKKLGGKALEAYDTMSVQDMEDFEEFKADNLRTYKLRPKIYRLQFRNGRKGVGDSYIDCARYVEQVFKRWIASEQV